MFMPLISSATTLPTTVPSSETTADVMQAALRVSGISLIGIFAVMAFFAIAIVLVQKLCPASSEEKSA